MKAPKFPKVPALWSRHVDLVPPAAKIIIQGSRYLHVTRSQTQIPLCGRVGPARPLDGKYGLVCPNCYAAAQAAEIVIGGIAFARSDDGDAGTLAVVRQGSTIGILSPLKGSTWAAYVGQDSTAHGWPKGMSFAAAIGFVLDVQNARRGRVNADQVKGVIPPCIASGDTDAAHVWNYGTTAAACLRPGCTAIVSFERKV